jgi:hypothetical protein
MNSPAVTHRTVLRKTYSEPYVLDRSKLSRMLTIIEQRLTERSISFSQRFSLVLQNEKHLVLHSLQDVFALDNSIKNPIRNLETEIGSDSKNSAGAEANVHLGFDSDHFANIFLNVASPDTKLATELFAELEEQIDRTVVGNWILKYLKSGDILFKMLGGLILISTLLAALLVSRRMKRMQVRFPPATMPNSSGF